MATFSMKTLLMFAGTVTLSMAMRSSIPLLYDLPMIWGVLMAWLKPPYIYFIINGIILTIVFASRFQPDCLEKQLSGQLHPLITARTLPPADFVNAFAQPEIKSVVDESYAAAFGSDSKVLELKPVVNLNEEDKLVEVDVIHEEQAPAEKEVVTSSTMDPPPEPESELLLSPAAEKPLVSSRFAHRGKPSVKAGLEGMRGLRVARQKKQGTLESTWKAITEGRHVPLTRHLQKLDGHHENQQNQSRRIAAAAVEVAKPSSGSHRGTTILRKPPSLSQDELNRRVEAFIKKFNDEMRIQRQQSLQQYMEMINRGGAN